MAVKSIINMRTSKFLTFINSKTHTKSGWWFHPFRRLYNGEISVNKMKSKDETNAATGDSIVEILRLPEDFKALKQEISSLQQKNVALMEKYHCSLAENENLRSRLNKQIANAKIFGIQSFCRDLLEFADILGHAIEAVPQNELNGSNPHLKKLYDGLTLTKNSLMQVFKRHGIEPIDPINETFNPYLHEALFQELDATLKPETIVEVAKLGYKLHERVIRPALVGVSKAS